MSGALPVCSGAAAVRAFGKAGWQKRRQRGSHITLTKPGSMVVLTVPLHTALAPGTLRALIRNAEMTVQEFADLL